jgi:hypothetical protein
MTMATYSELVSEVGDWLNRADLDAKIPTFVRLFEARMNRRLRNPDMEQTFTFTTVSGTTIYPLSSRVRELREVYINDDGTLTQNLNYTVTAENIEFSSDPGDGIVVTYRAFTTLSALGTGNATNWLLDDHPDAYLYGTLAEAYAHLRDNEQAATYKGLGDEVLAEIVREGNSKRLPAGPLQMQSPVIE